LDKALSRFIKAILPDSRISFSIVGHLVSKQNYQHPIYCQVELYFRRGDHVSPEEGAKNNLTQVEYPSDAQHTSPGSRLVRTIGIVRAKAKIGLQIADW